MARIVVADNDQDALDLLLLDLRLEGHEVVGACDGDTAYQLVTDLDTDVVVLDHRMPPGPTGLDVALRLRAERPDLRVIVYSNYQDAQLMRRAADHGVLFLPKGHLRTLRTAVTS